MDNKEMVVSRKRPLRSSLITLLALVVAGCSSSDPAVAHDVAEDSVDNAYVEAIDCLVDKG